MAQQEGGAEANWNQEYMIIRTIIKMSDASAEGKEDAYYSYFKDGLQMVMCYHPLETRIALEKKYTDLKTAIQSIEEDKKFNEDSKRVQIRKLKLKFADAYQFHIFNALPTMGIQKVEMDADIDDGVVSFEDLKAIVRDNSGTAYAVKKHEVAEEIIEAQETDEPEPVIENET